MDRPGWPASSLIRVQFCLFFEQVRRKSLFCIERNLCGIMVIMLNALITEGKRGPVDNFWTWEIFPHESSKLLNCLESKG